MSNIDNMGEYIQPNISSQKQFIDYSREHNWDTDNGFFVISDQNNSILGIISFKKPAHYLNCYEIGFVIFKPENRGKGYISEAINLFVSYLFDIKNVERLQATVNSNNKPSIKVLERCGFKYEGTLRKALFFKGKNSDIMIYSVLRNEIE